MADNASGFRDFSTLLGLNAEDESRLFEEAMARAQAADLKQRLLLKRAEREAQGRYNGDGQIVGRQADISATGSYDDYLQAKRGASQAWAELNASASDPDPFRGAMLGGRRGEIDAAMAAMGAGQAREDAAARRVQANYESGMRMDAEAAARVAAAKEAAAARQARDAEARKAALAQLGNPSDFMTNWIDKVNYRDPRTGKTFEDARANAQAWLALQGPDFDPSSKEGRVARAIVAGRWNALPDRKSVV